MQGSHPAWAAHGAALAALGYRRWQCHQSTCSNTPDRWDPSETRNSRQQRSSIKTAADCLQPTSSQAGKARRQPAAQPQTVLQHNHGRTPAAATARESPDQQQPAYTRSGAGVTSSSAPSAPGASIAGGENGGAAVLQTLRALGRYQPSSLSEGPTSVARAVAFTHIDIGRALQEGTPLLRHLSLLQLSGVACALAALGHRLGADAEDSSLALFLEALADAACARLARGVPSSAEWRPVCQMALGLSRLGARPLPLLEQLAAAAALLLASGVAPLRRRPHVTLLALLPASYAALRLHPPSLFDAVAEAIKGRGALLRLLDGRELVALLWAYRRVAHDDAPLLHLVSQRAAVCVGQLSAHELCRAYATLGSVRCADAALLAAMRRAAREKLNVLKPPQLAALLLGLGGLGHRDALLLDEAAFWVHHKAGDFSGAQISQVAAACAALGYRNGRLLQQLARMLVSRRVARAEALRPTDLALLAQALASLRFGNTRLMGRLAEVGVALVPQAAPAQLAALLRSFAALRHHDAPLCDAVAAAAAAAAVARTQGGGTACGSGGCTEDGVVDGAVGWSTAAVEAAVAREAAAHVAAWPVGELASVAWSLAVLNHTGPAVPAVAQAAAKAAAAQLDSMAAEQLVRLAWACLVLDQAEALGLLLPGVGRALVQHAKHARTHSAAKRLLRLAGAEMLQLLQQEWLLGQQQQQHEDQRQEQQQGQSPGPVGTDAMGGERLQRQLRACWQPLRAPAGLVEQLCAVHWTPQQAQQVQALSATLAQATGRVVRMAHRVEGGPLLVDVAVLGEVGSPHTAITLAGGSSSSGHGALQQRLLKALGWRVLALQHESWQALRAGTQGQQLASLGTWFWSDVH